MIEIGQQARYRLIGLGGKTRMVTLDIGMPVPAPLVGHASRVDLNKAGPALDQPAGHHALSGKVLGLGLIETVKVFQVFGFRRDVQSLRRRALHTIGQFETFDAGGQFLFEGIPIEVQAIEIGHQIELPALAGRIVFLGPVQVVDRITRRPEVGPLINAR